jgi:hypothetical protein
LIFDVPMLQCVEQSLQQLTSAVFTNAAISCLQTQKAKANLQFIAEHDEWPENHDCSSFVEDHRCLIEK